MPVRRLGFAPELHIPLGQHIGAPAQCVVKVGQRLERGSLIAEGRSFVSASIHAPVTGTVRKIGWLATPQGQRIQGIVLASEPGAGQEHVPFRAPPDLNDPGQWVDAVARSGLVGLGGAAFPTHVKLKVPDGRNVDTVMINGAECEPYLTADHRAMLEWPDDIVSGSLLMKKVLGAERVVIGVEANKMDAVKALERASNNCVDIRVVQVKYPQGAEKMLIRALLRREVPAGGLPMDVGVVVANVQTAAMIARLVPKGLGLVERIVTVAGDAVEKPGNYLVPIGTPVGFLLQSAGVVPDCQRVILGGPMMGVSVADLQLPITKGTSGVLAFKTAQDHESGPCIRCGYCVQACPMSLNPAAIMRSARGGDLDGCVQYRLRDCFECGSCAFVCPSKIPLVQYFRQAKLDLRKQPVAV